jgi:hypothetical protein
MTTVELGPFVAGEVPEPWEHAFQDDNGAAINLTGYTAKITFSVSGAAPVTRNATVSDPANGEVTYVWVAADLPAPGVARGELWVSNGTNTYAQRFVARIHARRGAAVTFP